jgi:hypothetical protein
MAKKQLLGDPNVLESSSALHITELPDEDQ